MATGVEGPAAPSRPRRRFTSGHGTERGPPLWGLIRRATMWLAAPPLPPIRSRLTGPAIMKGADVCRGNPTSTWPREGDRGRERRSSRRVDHVGRHAARHLVAWRRPTPGVAGPNSRGCENRYHELVEGVNGIVLRMDAQGNLTSPIDSHTPSSVIRRKKFSANRRGDHRSAD